MPIPTVQQLQEALTDINDLESFVNGAVPADITTRLGTTYPNLLKVTQAVIAGDATGVGFDNNNSRLDSLTVQAAIDELSNNTTISVKDYVALRDIFNSSFDGSSLEEGQLVNLTDPGIHGPGYLQRFDSNTDSNAVVDDAVENIVINNEWFWRRLNNSHVISLGWTGATGEGDDTQAIKDLMTYAESVATTGAVLVRSAPGKTYNVTELPEIPSYVILDMNGSKFDAVLGAGNVYGVRIGEEFSGIMNGEIEVSQSGTPSSQYIFHACISLGKPNGGSGTPSSPAKYSEVSNFGILNMTLKNTSRNYQPVIQGMGNCHHGLVENINIPTSATCSGVHFDWSDIGPNVSSANIALTRTTFDAGDCYTTHPNHITIRNIKCGNLSVAKSGDLGSNIVRLSGCYAITCENLEADNTTLSGFRNVGGDLGFEFAPANVKKLAQKGITVDTASFLDPQSDCGDMLYIDTYGDNIGRERYLTGYSPLMDPLMHGDIVARNINALGPNVDGIYGARITQGRGIKIEGGTFSFFEKGVWVDEYSDDVQINGAVIAKNRREGGLVGFTGIREDTSRVSFTANTVYGNGTDVTNDGIVVNRGTDVTLDSNIFGEVGESTQRYSIRIVDTPNINNIKLRNNHTVDATTAAYVLTASTPNHPLSYRAISEFKNNTADPRVPLFYGGAALPCIESHVNVTNRQNAHFMSTASSAPTNGVYYQGDYVETPKVAGAAPGYHCTTSGQSGTLSGLTNAATDGTAVVTMSLTGKTITTTSNSYTATLNDATNIRVGLKITSAAAGLTNATIVGLSGTTVNLDVPATTTQSGGAMTTAGVIAGEVLSLDTTPAVSSAIVKSVDSDSVTLDTSTSSTETGRTVSYTTAVFKADAAIAS